MVKPVEAVKGFLILFFVVFLVACETSYTDIEHVQRAKDFQDEGDLNAAVIELKNALVKNASNPESRWLLGKIYVEISEGVSAEKELEEALKLGVAEEDISQLLAQALLLQQKYAVLIKRIRPHQHQNETTKTILHVYRARAYLGLQQLVKAENELTIAAKFDPENIELLTMLAVVDAQKGSIDDAYARIQKVLQDAPNYSLAWSTLGDLERYLENSQAAIDAYSKAIDLRVNNVSDFIKRVFLRISTEDYGGARQNIAQLKKKFPNHPLLLYGEGLVNFRQVNYAQAQSFFEQTLGQTPEYQPAIFYLGATHYFQSHFEQAENYLTRFYSRNPQSALGAELLGALYLRNNNAKAAAAVLKPLIKLNSEDPEMLNILASLALMQGDFSESVKHLERVVQMEPQSSVARMRLGQGYFLANDFEKSIGVLEESRELDASNADLEIVLYRAYMRAGEYHKALEIAQGMIVGQPESADSFTFAGGAYLVLGEEEKAKSAFYNALKFSPGNINATQNLARMLVATGKIEDAQDLYHQAIANNPGYAAEGYLHLADLEALRGKSRDMLQYIERAIEADPGALHPRIKMATFNLVQNRPGEALAQLNAVSESFSSDPSWMNGIGEVSLALGQLETAVDMFRKVVAIQPENVSAYYSLAKAYTAVNDAALARKNIAKALDIDRSHIPSRLIEIRLMIIDGKYGQASKSLDELMQIEPDNSVLIAQKGYLVLLEKNYKQAQELFDRAIAKMPTTQLTVYLAQSQWLQGDTQQAIDTLEKWLDNNESDFTVRFELATAYLMLENYESAKINYQKAVELSPDHVLTLNNLSWLLRRDNPDKALQYAEHALEVSNGAPYVQGTVGEILLITGQLERALGILQDANAKLPNDPGISYYLARALAESGMETEAAAVLKELLAAHDSFPMRPEADRLLVKLLE